MQSENRKRFYDEPRYGVAIVAFMECLNTVIIRKHT